MSPPKYIRASAHQASLCSNQQNLPLDVTWLEDFAAIFSADMADPAATTMSVATTITTRAVIGSSGSGGLGLDPAIVEALRGAVLAESPSHHPVHLAQR